MATVVERAPVVTAEEAGGRTIPMRLAYLVVLGCALLGLLWAVSSPSPPFLLVAVAGLLLVLLGVVWLGSVLAAAVRAVRRRPSPRRPGWMLVAASMLAVAAALAVVDAPLHGRFALSRGAMDGVVADAHPDLPPGDEVDLGQSGWVGLYRVERVRQVGDAVLIQVGGAFLANEGFAHLPDGPSPELERGSGWGVRTFRHLRGDWYTYTETVD